jgi:hypothetical protein
VQNCQHSSRVLKFGLLSNTVAEQAKHSHTEEAVSPDTRAVVFRPGQPAASRSGWPALRFSVSPAATCHHGCFMCLQPSGSATQP